jgi:hypothetical protein
MTKQFIPSPPQGVSIMPNQGDPDIDALASELMAINPQQAQPMQQADPDIDILANEAMGVNSQLEQPLPTIKPGLKSAPSAGPSIKRKNAGSAATSAPKLTPPPAPYQVAGQQFMQSLSGIGQQFDRGLGRIGNAIGQIPVIGPAAQGMAQQANMAQAEMARDPIGSSAAALINAPRGVLNVVDAVGNTITRQLNEWGPTASRGGPMAAPFNLAGTYDQIPGVKTLQEAYPGQSGTGQSAGASTIPVHTPIPIGNPVIRGAVQGGIGGQFLGSVESAGQQARQGPVNYGKAAVEGVPVALLGAGLGAGMGKALGKGFGKATKEVKAQVTEPPKPQTPPPSDKQVVMADGSKLDVNTATRALRDQSTPPEVKEELKQLLQAKDDEFANAGMRVRGSFADLGADPAIADVQARIKQSMEAAKTTADIEQLKADGLKYIQKQYRGVGDVRSKMIEFVDATAKQQSLRTSAAEYASRPAPAPVPRDFAAGISRVTDSSGVGRPPAPDIKENTSNPLKPAELDPTDPLAQDMAFQNEMAQRFPEGEVGSMARGSFNPRELTDSQLAEAVTEGKPDGRTGAAKDNNFLDVETARRQWVRENYPDRQDWPAEEAPQPQTDLPPGMSELESAPAPPAAAEPPAPPATDPRFFGDTRRYNQGVNGYVQVQFPTPFERNLAAYSGKSTNGPELAQRLGIAESELRQVAKDYQEQVKQLAREAHKRNEWDLLAPKYEKPLPRAATAPEPAAPPEMAAAEPPVLENRFTYQKNTEKPGGYVDLIDNSTGEVISSSKRTEAQAAALAAKYNDLATNAPDKLEAELNRGSKNFLDWTKSTDKERAQIVEKGSTLPEGHELTEPMNRLAETKHSFDEARARYDASVDAFYKHIKATQGTTTKRARAYIQEIEDLTAAARKAGSDELTLEVNSANKLEPKAPKFQRGMTPEDAIAMVENLHAEMKAREEAYLEARKEVHDPFLKSNLGSVNLPHSKGVINVRPVPKQGTELNATTEMMRGVTEELAGPIPERVTPDRTITAARKIAKARGIKGRNQRGSISIKAGGRKAPPAKTVEEALADGMNNKETSDIANDLELVRGVLTLRNTFDIAREVSTDLHSELMLGVGKEALAAHDIKFDGPQAALAEQSLQLEPWTIREGGTPEIDLSSMSDQQLNYLATRKSIRSRMAESVRDELTALDTEYGSLDNMPNKVKNQYTTLEQLEQSLTGYVPRTGTTEGAVLGILRNAMYDYLFKWNGAYHSLNLIDPFIVGSSRVGLTKIMAAKTLLQSDPAVKAYVKGVPNETPIQAMRKETLIDSKTPKGVKTGTFTKIKKGIATLQSKLPDLPSERWNFEDSWLAGIIERGDRIGYEGGGTQYAKDLATGKLSIEEQMQAYADSMNVAQEITGSGSFGLNKDTIQRIGPLAKAVTMFTSQPMRQSRIMADIITKDMKTDPAGAAARLLSFAAASTFFGGRALLPKEFDLLEQFAPKEFRPFFRGVQDFLDNWKLFEKVPIVGRDLTDKLRTSMLPFIGGAQTNILLGEVAKIGRAFEGKKYDEAAKSAILWALSGFLGGGGLEAGKVLKSTDAAKKGDRDISAYPTEYIPASGGSRPAAKKKFSQITGEKYSGMQAIKDSVLPGQDPRIGAFIKKARREKMDKK